MHVATPWLRFHAAPQQMHALSLPHASMHEARVRPLGAAPFRHIHARPLLNALECSPLANARIVTAVRIHARAPRAPAGRRPLLTTLECSPLPISITVALVLHMRAQLASIVMCFALECLPPLQANACAGGERAYGSGDEQAAGPARPFMPHPCSLARARQSLCQAVCHRLVALALAGNALVDALLHCGGVGGCWQHVQWGCVAGLELVQVIAH